MPKRIVTCLLCLITWFPETELNAAEIQASHLLPESIVGFVAIDSPKSLLGTVLDHPLNARIQGLDVFKKATMSEGYRSFLTGRKFFELQIGKDWRPAIEDLTSQGIYGGFDRATEGGVLLVRAKDETTMENFRVKILELTRLSGGAAAKPDDYRDLPIYKLDKGGAVVVREWLILTNNAELGKGVIDRLLDQSTNEPIADVAGTLSSNARFKSAEAARKKESHNWAFVDLQAIRDAGAAKKLFEGKAENPLAELLIGGIQSTLQHSPYVAANLVVASTGLKLEFATPYQADWIPEERAYYFGPENSGTAPVLPGVPETLLTLGTYRNVSEMWMRAGDLFNEQTNDKLAEADSGLSTIFAGRDFGEEILGSFESQIGIIVTRQSFAGATTIPAIKLPAFAMVLKLRDPETMRSELRRTFQSAIGFFNIVGAQNGQPQLEMDMQKVGDVDLITSRYLATKKDKDSTSAPILFNFSPSAGFNGDQFVLASTADLAQQLSVAPHFGLHPTANTCVAFDAGVAVSALDDNREQLISQNMLSEGNSREEAEAAIGLLLEILGCFKGAGLNLDRSPGQLALRINLELNEVR